MKRYYKTTITKEMTEFFELTDVKISQNSEPFAVLYELTLRKIATVTNEHVSKLNVYEVSFSWLPFCESINESIYEHYKLKPLDDDDIKFLKENELIK